MGMIGFNKKYSKKTTLNFNIGIDPYESQQYGQEYLQKKKIKFVIDIAA